MEGPHKVVHLVVLLRIPDFFFNFNEFLYVFAILDFFSKTIIRIVLILFGNVPCGRVTQECSLGSIAADP